MPFSFISHLQNTEIWLLFSSLLVYKYSIKQKASQQPSAVPLHPTCLNRDLRLEESVCYCHRHMHTPWDISTAQLNIILECLCKNTVFLSKEDKCSILIFVACKLVKWSGERNRILVPTSNPELPIIFLENFFIKRSEMAHSSGSIASVGFDYV